VRLRRAEEIETLSYRTVVELNAESRLAPSGGWRRLPVAVNAPTAGRGAGWRADRRQAERASRPHRHEREMVADAR
jgi:hypothetical protein